MNLDGHWWAGSITLLIMLGYEVRLIFLQKQHPDQLARSAHATLREDWLTAVSAQKGSEILAVQTLRNSVMAATMTASTAVLGLIGSVTLAFPTLHNAHSSASNSDAWYQVALLLALMLLLFASLVSSTMAVRFYNHAGFVGGMPVESEQRKKWNALGIRYVRRAGLLYSWGIRHLIMVAPILASIVHPFAGPAAAIVIVSALYVFDRTDISNPL